MALVGPWLRRIFNAEFGRFLLVGLSNTALGYAVFRICLSVLPESAFRATVSQLLAYLVGTLWSFLWNRSWTFKSRDPAGRQAFRFVLLQFGMALASSALIGVAVDHLHLPATPSWVIVTGFITVANYVGSRYWAFAQPR